MTDLWNSDARDLARAEVLRAVAAQTGVPVETIVSRSRRPNVVAARRRVMWELHERGWSTPLIGRAVNRDHVTVLHALGMLGRQQVA